MPERRRITFSGRVQGVGFRATTVQLAADLPLAGTVQNLENGDVELLVQGELHQIDALLARLREHFGSFIRTIHQTSGAPSPGPPTSGPAPGIHILH